MSRLAVPKDRLTDISMFVGVTIGLLTVVDWLLSDKQKEKLRDYFERLWVWLDDQRYGHFTRALRSRRIQKLLTGALYSILLIFQVSMVILHPEQLPKSFAKGPIIGGSLIALALIFLLSRKVHPRVIDWVVGRGAVVGFFARGAAAYVAGMMTLLLILILMLSARKMAPGPTVPHTLITIVDILIMVIVLYPLLVETILVGVMLGWSLLWFINVLLLLVFLRTTQFVVLRVVEYPKGPILGLSGLLIGIAAVLKALI